MHSWLTHVSVNEYDRRDKELISLTVLPDDLLKEAIPGNIRKAEHFVAFLKRFVEYLKVRRPFVVFMPSKYSVALLFRRGCECFMSSPKLLFLSSNISKTSHTLNEDPYGMLSEDSVFIVAYSYSRFCAERLQSMVRTLELQRIDEYASLQKVASFATLVATYEKGERSPFVIASIAELFE